MKRIVGGVLVVFLATTAAMAGSITETKTFSGVPTLTRILNFSQFDTMGGTRTLTSIYISFLLNVNNGSILLDNDGVDPASGTFEFGAEGGISSTDVALLDGSTVPRALGENVKAIHADTFSLDSNDGDSSSTADLGGPDSMLYEGGLESMSDTGYIGSDFFAAYIGGGTFDIAVDVSQWAEFGGKSGVAMALIPLDSTGEVKVKYNYTPEPASMILLAIGAPLLFRARSKK